MFWSTPCCIISSQIAVCSNPAVGHLKPMSSSSCRSGSSALSYSLQTYQTMLKRSEWRFICTTSPSAQGLQGTIEFLFEQLQFGPHQATLQSGDALPLSAEKRNWSDSKCGISQQGDDMRGVEREPRQGNTVCAQSLCLA